MTRRDWYAGGVGGAVTGAIVGALMGSGLILAWNMVSLILSLVMWELEVRKQGEKC